MPDAYFKEIDESTRNTHLKALVALETTGQKPEISIYNNDKSNITFIKPHNYIGLLAEIIESLPKDRDVAKASIFTLKDSNRDLVVDVFEFEALPTDDFSMNLDEERLAEIFSAADETIDKKKLREFLIGCNKRYVMLTNPLEIIRDFEKVQNVHDTDNIVVSVSPTEHDKLVVVLPADYGQDAFLRVVQHLSRNNLDIVKATFSRCNWRDHYFLILNCFVASNISLPEYSSLCGDIRRVLFLDESVLTLLKTNTANWRLYECEVIMTIANLCHSYLAEKYSAVYNFYQILKFIDEYPEIVTELLSLWNIKCSGEVLTSDLIGRIQTLIDMNVEREDCNMFFFTFLKIIKCLIKTNIWNMDRMSLTFSLDSFFLKDYLKAVPSECLHDSPDGILFFFGRGFIAVHVRFKDIARGGVRIVIPESLEQHDSMKRRLLIDSYELAWSQHLKNKDIPEGGSKSVILVTPHEVHPEYDASNCLKAFTDSVLDMITNSRSADLVKVNEWTYLGPDENITNDMITWMYNRAVFRKYPFPNAFISSKPGAGINHQEYGVVMEGLSVFLSVALKRLKIEVPFSVKLVNVNGEYGKRVFSVLHRDYGNSIRIVAVSDESGVVEDPRGLDHFELMRLASNGLPLKNFQKSKLSSTGYMVGTTESNGQKYRNDMPFRVKSDVFIPLGGRPNTINEYNWKRFFINNIPSSSLILEGANIYVNILTKQDLSPGSLIIVVQRGDYFERLKCQQDRRTLFIL